MPTYVAKRPMSGVAMPVAVLYGADGTTPVSGYISPAFQSAKPSHTVTKRELRGPGGDIDCLMVREDGVECSFEIIPQGTTEANALASARLPLVGTRVKISGMPVVAVGSFSDVFNADATNPWIYTGGGSINAINETEWSMTIPLMRYPGITTATIIA